MVRPTFDSLKLRPHVGRETILFKEAQAGMQGAGLPPSVGQSPVTGSADEMQAPESADQRQFENDFGSLAYQFVQDRAPALVPYMLGFEVVDRNEDGSKAVGIFGYKVDDDFYYVPAFFLNNQVRGVDMMLNKKTNQFVPLTEKWIDFVVNKHSIRIGSPASTEVRDTMRNPDLSFVRRPQVALGKMAEDARPWTPKEAWEHIKEATARLAEDPEFREMFAGIAAKGRLQKTAESRYLKDFMEKVGGPECMTRFLRELHNVDFANAALALYKDAEAFWTDRLANASIHVDRMRKAAAARPKVTVVDRVEGLAKAAQDAPKADVGDEDGQLTPEEDARQVVEHDFTIRDERPAEEVAEVTDDEVLVDFEHRFQPPDGPGKYSFMMADGMAREGVMLKAVLSPDCSGNDTLIVFEDDGNVLAKADPMAIVATEPGDDRKHDGTGDDLKELFDRAQPIPDVEIGTGEDPRPYLFIDDKGHAAGPFFLRFVLADGDHVRFVTGYGSHEMIVTRAKDGLAKGYGFMDWNLRDDYHDADGRRNDECSRWRESCEFCEACGSSDLVSIGSFSGLPKKTGAGVIIPHDWKALPLRQFPAWARSNDGADEKTRRENDARCAMERAEAEGKYTFASAIDILESMKSQGIERVKVASDGVDYSIVVDGARRRHGPFGYKAASVELVTRFGFRPRRAFAALDKAASAGSAMFLVRIPSLARKQVKQAQDGLVGVSMPAPSEQLPSVDPYTGVPVYFSPYVDETQGQFTGVPGLPPEGGMTRGINVGGEMERGMGQGDYPDEHSDSFGEGALPIDAQARQLAEDAAKAGQRHVFDQAAIGGLVKVYDTANVVDSYIPDFMDTLDRLGRILFLFYWRHEDFNQRYGSDDVVQMEDQLRNVFKQMGELTLNLKEKAVNKD